MLKKAQKFNYDIFHKTTSIQTKTITENNFTYRILLGIINHLHIKPKKILDIGCGAGTLSLYYARKGYKVVGIDISKKAVDAASKSAMFLGLKNAFFQKIDFPNEIPKGKFDFIIFTEVIEHLKNDDLALKKIYSLLDKKGIAIITTPSKNAPLYRLGLAKKFDKKVGHLRRYSLNDLADKCVKNNFKIIKTGKTEGLVRNFLFLNPVAGKLVKFIKFFLSDWVTYIDYISLKLFGESNIYVVIQKL
jgi:SAM-dependent methyltransferase